MWGGGGGVVEGLDFGLLKCQATFVSCSFLTDHCCPRVLMLHVLTSIAVC